MRLKFVHKKSETKRVYSYFFEPDTQQDWIAGQSIKLEFPQILDSTERRFTISSAPSEESIRITTASSGSDFKNELHKLDAGDQVIANSINGDFIWRETSLHTVFLAAGIGVTPYRAILADRVLSGKQIPSTLIYANRDPEELVFKQEFDEWQSLHPEFKVIYQIEKRLDLGFISQHCDMANSLFYVSGPGGMVDDIVDGLKSHGITDENIIKDWFVGLDSKYPVH
ncbi:MAG TPA: FAD-dependent oxidoreductase [Candidatus Saccharimonadales bacterium]|nr:FAD-dependent oxidoreductase [Candidatus Saccharimonadales bacterium]